MNLRVSLALSAGIALVALWPSASRAAGPSPVASKTLFALQPLAALHWSAPSLLRVQPLLVSPGATRASFSFGYRHSLPRLLTPELSAPATNPARPNPARLLSVQLARPEVEEDERSEVDDAARVGLSYLNPTLLRFADDATDVAVTISPGGLCTGACLKVTGSFQ